MISVAAPVCLILRVFFIIYSFLVRYIIISDAGEIVYKYSSVAYRVGEKIMYIHSIKSFLGG